MKSKTPFPRREITKKIEEVLASEIDRVGQKLRVDAIALTNASGDKGKFESAAKLIASKAPNVPVILFNRPCIRRSGCKALCRQEAHYLWGKLRQYRGNGKYCKRQKKQRSE